MKRAVVDVDDLIEEAQITRWLVPLKKAVPGLVVTAYCPPNKLGPVHDLAAKYPWIIFAIHGWEHTHFECLTWSDERCERALLEAMRLGYADLFKPPNWICHAEIEAGCAKAGVVLHHHIDYKPSHAGLRAYRSGINREHAGIHTHILKNPATDFIEGHPLFAPEHLSQFEKFDTPFDHAVTV